MAVSLFNLVFITMVPMAITIASAPENQTNWQEMFHRLQVELVFYLLVCCWSMGLNGAKYFFKVSSHFTTWIVLNNCLDTLSIQDKIENESKEMKSRLDKLERENLNLKQTIANIERKSKGNNSCIRHLLTSFTGRWCFQRGEGSLSDHNHDALDTRHGTYPSPWHLPSLQTCSNLFTWGHPTGTDI